MNPLTDSYLAGETIGEHREEMNRRFDHLEAKHGNCVDRLEDDVRVVRTGVGIK